MFTHCVCVPCTRGSMCVCIKPHHSNQKQAQDVEHELPMLPSTMIRNVLGKELGGSGVPLDEAKYRESVAFWSDYAAIR